MKYYIQFMLICLFAVIGEALSTFFKLPVPGSIIGLFLLLIALQLKWIRLRHIHAVAEFLIVNMTILFCQQVSVLWNDGMLFRRILFQLF